MAPIHLCPVCYCAPEWIVPWVGNSLMQLQCPKGKHGPIIPATTENEAIGRWNAWVRNKRRKKR